jgi:MinD superfamily P-loop ATPase
LNEYSNCVIASGKGGTGKKTFSVNIACALACRGDHVGLLDCDFEEHNVHLFVRPESRYETPVKAMKPVWNEYLNSAHISKSCD